MAGFLVPAWFHQQPPSAYGVEVVGVLLGITVGFAVFAAAKATRQTYLSWHRLGGRLSSYIIMVWLSWSATIVLTGINYAYLKGSVPPSFWFFFFEIIIWGIQVVCLLQILANRISLVMFNDVWAKRLRIIVGVAAALLVIMVGIVYIPSQLQTSHAFEVANSVVGRLEKAIFLVIDAILNFLFLYLVRSKLILSGLTKYWALFWFNLAMVAISISLDITAIGIVSLSLTEIYVQFRALIFLVKLYIEMMIAELIAKVVRSTGPRGSIDDVEADGLDMSGGDRSTRTTFES